MLCIHGNAYHVHIVAGNIRTPQQETEKILLHSHGKHSYAKVPNICIILAAVNYWYITQ